MHNQKYFLTIIDDHSRHTWVHLMSSKYDARRLVDFVAYVQTQFHMTVKAIRSDNGPEFHMPIFYRRKGILHQTS